MERSRRRHAILAVILTALVVSVPVGASSADRPGPCAKQRLEDEPTRRFMRRLIRCATNRWEVPGGAERAICIARRESGLDPNAVSEPEGLYVGLFQHDAELWPDRYESWTRPRWELRPSALNGRTNAIVTIRMVNTNGWGPWEGEGC
jgi:hypothetical protein